MQGLSFDSAQHAYRLDDRPVTGVTGALQVISSAEYAFVDPDVLEAASMRGQAVHRLIELDCLGDLDLEDLDSVYRPYYDAWRHFLATSGFAVVLSESKVFSRRYGFAGQLDLFGRLNGIPATIDAKCVVRVMGSTGPQTMAYTQALRECKPDLLPPFAPCRRYALQLHPDKRVGASGVRWHLHPFHDDAADLRLFLSCLNVSNYLARKS